jgi:hypothetical protein
MKLALALAIGAVLGAIGMTVASDYAARAPGDEVERCPERPDQAAFMGRKPGETHSVEACLYMMRFSDPRWIPEFVHPLKQGAVR